MLPIYQPLAPVAALTMPPATADEAAQTKAVPVPPTPQAEIDRRGKAFADFFNEQVLDIDIEKTTS